MAATISPAIAGARNSWRSSSERRRGHVGLDADGHRHCAAVGAAELLVDDRLVRVVETHTAVGLGLVDAEEAQGRHLLEDLLGGQGARGFPLVDVGVDLLADEVADGAPQLLVLVGEAHGWAKASADPVRKSPLETCGRSRSRAPLAAPGTSWCRERPGQRP
jgi:hypothetical protein